MDSNEEIDEIRRKINDEKTFPSSFYSLSSSQNDQGTGKLKEKQLTKYIIFKIIRHFYYNII